MKVCPMCGGNDFTAHTIQNVISIDDNDDYIDVEIGNDYIYELFCCGCEATFDVYKNSVCDELITEEEYQKKKRREKLERIMK